VGLDLWGWLGIGRLPRMDEEAQAPNTLHYVGKGRRQSDGAVVDLADDFVVLEENPIPGTEYVQTTIEPVWAVKERYDDGYDPATERYVIGER
jgi:hypothetical protein